MERYSRQIKLLGEDGQKKIRSAGVMVAGVGGLGSYLALELTALGVGKILLVDPQRVELSNLNRQILYTTDDIGRLKVEVAARRLTMLNPEVRVEPVAEEITGDNIDGLVKKVDLVVDGLDNWRTRLIVNDSCVLNMKPFIHGGVKEFYGQVLTVIPGKGPCLRCLIPEPPKTKETLQVISGVVGAVASLQVVEAIKILTGKGEPAVGRILVYDGLEQSLSQIKIVERPDCPVCSVIKRRGSPR